MKTKSGLLAAALFLAALPALVAADQPAKADVKNEPKAAAKADATKGAASEKTMLLTGSNIPQKVTKDGRSIEGAQPLTVITHDDLEKSGQNNLAMALRKMVPQIH